MRGSEVMALCVLCVCVCDVREERDTCCVCLVNDLIVYSFDLVWLRV